MIYYILMYNVLGFFFLITACCIFFKAADCPANSHFTQCSNNCANTCASLGRSVNCPDICVEGCQCDEGWLSDGWMRVCLWETADVSIMANT